MRIGIICFQDQPRGRSFAPEKKKKPDEDNQAADVSDNGDLIKFVDVFADSKEVVNSKEDYYAPKKLIDVLLIGEQ